MAMTWAEYYNTQTTATGGDITSSSFSVAVDDLIVVLFCSDDNFNTGNVSISNSGTAISWGSPFAITNTSSNCKAVAWKGKATAAESITVTVLGDGSVVSKSAISCIVHTGAHATDPVPSGNIFSGVGGNDVSQSITPTSAGSCLWMVLGDWNFQNALTLNSNCTTESSFHATLITTAIARPTTQPRTDTSAFTIGESSDAAGERTAWIAFEVQAAAGGISGAWLRA